MAIMHDGGLINRDHLKPKCPHYEKCLPKKFPIGKYVETGEKYKKSTESCNKICKGQPPLPTYRRGTIIGYGKLCNGYPQVLIKTPDGKEVSIYCRNLKIIDKPEPNIYDKLIECCEKLEKAYGHLGDAYEHLGNACEAQIKMYDRILGRK